MSDILNTNVALKTDYTNRNFYDLPENGRQFYERPNFALIKASQSEVARERSENKIKDYVVEIIKFLHLTKFATEDQMQRYFESNQNVGVNKDLLDDLVKNYFINRFYINDTELDFNEYSDEDTDKILYVYTLDFGGEYLLTYEGVDTTQWRYTQLFAGIEVIKKALQQTEFIIGLFNANNSNIRRYDQFKNFRVGDSEVDTDFAASLDYKNGRATINLLGFFVEPRFEDLYLRDKIEDIDKVMNKTNAWKKYYPLGGYTKPKIMFIVRSADKESFDRIIKVIMRASEYQTPDVYLIGYNELAAKGLANTRIYSFASNEDSYKLGVIRLDAFE